MSNIEKLQRSVRYPTLRVESEPSGASHWLYMHADAGTGIRPCFRTALMDEMWTYLNSITLPKSQRRPGNLRHVVIASDAPAFNLGGDLELFARLIRENNREQLLAYARRCVDGVHHIHSGLGGDVRTIALVQGDALGGGMELALSCHTIVAEEGCSMGLPEVLFGLFPGMGAYSFLCKRVTPQLAENAGQPDRYAVDEAFAASPTPAQSQRLASYMVAHSQYSTPMVRRNVLTSLLAADPGITRVSYDPGEAP